MSPPSGDGKLLRKVVDRPRAKRNDGCSQPEHLPTSLPPAASDDCVDLQVEVAGCVIPATDTIGVVIVAEAWPSWLPVLAALGFQAERLICPPEHLDLLNMKLPRSEPVMQLSTVSTDSVVLLSGTVGYLEHWWEYLSCVRLLVVALDGPVMRFRRLRRFSGMTWNLLKHSLLGGATVGRHWLGSSIPPGPIKVTGYHRWVGQFLDPTVQSVGRSAYAAAPVATPVHQRVVLCDQGSIHPRGLLPVDHSEFLVRCPCVFSPTRWCDRPLHGHEWCRMLDLPVELERHFKQTPFPLDLRQSTPIKVLMAYGTAVRTRIIQATLGREGGGVKSNTDLVSPSKQGRKTAVGEAVRTCEAKSEQRLKELEEGVYRGDEEVFYDAVSSMELGESGEEYSDPTSPKLTEHGSTTPADNPAKPINDTVTIERPTSSDGRNAEAVKADDAAVPEYLWNDQVLGRPATAEDRVCLGKLRWFVLGLWKRAVYVSFRNHMRRTHGPDWWVLPGDRGTELQRDREAGQDCLVRVMKATWWDWDDGSRLFFWRWPVHYRLQARDGVPPWLTGPLPKFVRPQPPEKDPARKEKVKTKLAKVRTRRYIWKGFVSSLTRYFAVDKGVVDIRMVYDGTVSGLNATIWAPNFGLPTVDSLLRGMDSTTWSCDNDLGEMFLNFMLHEDIQHACGVDVSPYFGANTVWERWERSLMGVRSSPFNTIQSFGIAEETIRGDPSMGSNPFRWDGVRLNLPGSADYDPQLPWVSKVRNWATGVIASDFFSYVDDIRPSGPSESECWAAARRIAGLCSYLGIQDAARKRRPPSQQPGAWAGSVTRAGSKGVGVLISEKKWAKTKALLETMRTELESQGDFCHKDLESTRGFLVYVSRTYPGMVPYLKGIHLTLDTWRGNRGDDGWKLTLAEFRAKLEDDDRGGSDDEMMEEETTTAPVRVPPVPRLADDLRSLLTLFSGDEPKVRWVRSAVVLVAYYGFGDASGSGFGSTLGTTEGIQFRHGLWGTDAAGESSNYRELRNLVESVEKEAASGRLKNVELFLCTDNSVAEAAFYNGTSSSRLLFELILRLRKVEMAEGMHLQLIHVAGTRMIAQGTDGLSRGNLTEGVMTGQSMLSHVPLDEGCFERVGPRLLDWVRDWTGRKGLDPLTPEDWFYRAHGLGPGENNPDGIWMPTENAETCFLWAPAPAAARVAVEELRRARHKRQNSYHVFVCPRLMTNLWRKDLGKVVDFLFELPSGAPQWPSDTHEPLVVGIVLPFIRSQPWQLRRAPKLLGMARQLRRVFQTPDGDGRPLLRELFELPNRLDSVPARVVRKLLQYAPAGSVSPTAGG